MNEMFSEHARRMIEFAHDEAVRLKHDYIGTEHLLLGLIKLREGRAVEILTHLCLNLDELRQSVEDVVQPSGEVKWKGQLPITARAKKVLELSGAEAQNFKSKDIETEHILLGLLKEEEGVAAQVLSMYDVGYKEAFEELNKIITGKSSFPGNKLPLSNTQLSHRKEGDRRIFRLMEYTRRIFKYRRLPLYITRAFKKSALERLLLNLHLEEFDLVAKPFFLDETIWRSEYSSETKSKFVMEQRELFEQTVKEEIGGYLQILRNQALVLSCTVFDDCLFEILKVITESKQEVLKGLDIKEDAMVADVIDSKDYPQLFNLIQNRVLEHFKFQGISKRIETFGKIGIDVGGLLKLSSHSSKVQAKYADGAKYLENIYRTRKNIVHRDIMVLKSQEELDDCVMFLHYLISELCYRGYQKFGIPIDLIEKIKESVNRT